MYITRRRILYILSFRRTRLRNRLFWWDIVRNFRRIVDRRRNLTICYIIWPFEFVKLAHGGWTCAAAGLTRGLLIPVRSYRRSRATRVGGGGGGEGGGRGVYPAIVPVVLAMEPRSVINDTRNDGRMLPPCPPCALLFPSLDSRTIRRGGGRPIYRFDLPDTYIHACPWPPPGPEHRRGTLVITNGCNESLASSRRGRAYSWDRRGYT